MIVDLQVSVGEEGVEAFLDGAKAKGLDGIVVANRDTPFGSQEQLKALGSERGLTIFAGACFETNHGPLLALVPKPDEALADGWASTDESGALDALSVIDGINDRGGVVIALRPYDRELDHPMGDHIFTLPGLAACEVLSIVVPASANELALEAASNLELPCVASSGADKPDSLGQVATLFRGPLASEAELIEAIRAGDCWPLSFSDQVPRTEGGRDRGRGGRGGRGGRRDNHSGQGGRDRGRGGRGGRSGGQSSGGGRRGGRRRGGGGGGGGGGRRGGGPMRDDVGNRAARSRGPLDDDFGNRVRPEEQDAHLDDDVGNRLAPGERSQYLPPPPEPEFEVEEHDDEDDNFGNR